MMDLQVLKQSTFRELYSWFLRYLQSEIMTEAVCENIARLLACGMMHFSLVADEDMEIFIDYNPNNNVLSIIYDNDETDEYVLEDCLHRNIVCIVSANSENLSNMVHSEYPMHTKNMFYMPPRHNVVSLHARKKKKRHRIRR